MTNNGFIKILQIADTLADHPLLRDIPFDRIIYYTQELIRISGAPDLYIDKVAKIEVKHYKALLPCDFINIIQVLGDGCIEFVSATDNYIGTRENIGIPSYKIQGNVIITSLEECILNVAYRSIAVDEDGFPMIPDNAEFIRALVSYIKMRRFEILMDMGKVNANAYQNAQQEYCWNIGQAITGLKIPTEDEMETITNIWNTLVLKTTEHRNGFQSLHNKEFIKKH